MKLFSSILIVILTACSVSAESLSMDQVIIDKMFETYQFDSSSVEIEILSNRLHTKEYTNEEIKMKPLTLKEPRGLFTALVTLSKEGQKIETSQVRMRIKMYENVLVSLDRLKRHEELTTSNTTIERIETTNLRTKPFYTLEETKGYRLKGSVQKSIPLTTGMLEKIPDIMSGTETTIVYISSVFKITADGIALQSGSAGDLIRVKNKTSNKIIVARVIDSDHVAIDP